MPKGPIPITFKVVRNEKWKHFLLPNYDRAFRDESNGPFPAFLR